MKGVNLMVIITDCMYRSAIAAIYTLIKIGEDILAVTTDKAPTPPAFRSKFIKDKFVLSSDSQKYCDELIEVCKKYDRPVILPIGVFTLDIISKNIEKFEKVADFCVSEKSVLNNLNNKNHAKKAAENSGISIPTDNGSYPKVVKPYCGEKFGLKASERYVIVKNEEELSKSKEHFSKYDANPLVEEYIDGEGVGVSLVIGKDGNALSAFCHKRIYEYPASGGPSSMLRTFYDETIIRKVSELLKTEGFIGIAMAEFKLRVGEYYFLEINPRIWGSFGATYKCNSDFLLAYLAGARGRDYKFSPTYKNRKIKFVPNIFASVISYLKAGKIKKACGAFFSTINPFIPTAFFSIKDPLPSLYDIFRKRR